MIKLNSFERKLKGINDTIMNTEIKFGDIEWVKKKHEHYKFIYNDLEIDEITEWNPEEQDELTFETPTLLLLSCIILNLEHTIRAYKNKWETVVFELPELDDMNRLRYVTEVRQFYVENYN